MKKTVLFVFIMLAIIQSFASVIVENLSFEQPIIKNDGNYSTIMQENSFINGVVSEPAVTYKGVTLYLPKGEEATNVILKKSGKHEISLDNRLIPAQQQFPLSKMDEAYFTNPNNDIYTSNKYFPYTDVKNIRTDFLAGHSIATFALSTVEYNPINNTIIWYENIAYEVETDYSTKAQESQLLYKENDSVYKRIINSVDNPESVNFSYNNRSIGIDYLIIYPQAYATQIEQIAYYHNIRNLNVELLTIETITNEPVPNGATYIDLQDKIREYIKYYYSQPVNNLAYVLLAGDDDVIPHRGFWSDNDAQEDYDIPADNYYSNLDGSFDADGDGAFGESMDADLMPELAIGRICYNDNAELDNILNKHYKFTEEPVVDEVTTSFMTGEWLWEGPTYGGDYMDELIGTTDLYGYTTTGFPEDWTFTKLYDRDSGGADSWWGNDLYPFLSAGPTYINHLGHSNTTYNMRISNQNVTTSNITNNGINGNFSVDFSQGCYAGAFDNRGTSVGQYTSDCISERFTAIETSAVAMIANSRYGWGTQGSTNGASQYFHREWADAVFTENILSIGESLNDSKIDNIPNMDNPTMYWCYYETTLFGDPAMMLWSQTPEVITENIPPVWNMGLASYPLDITNDIVSASLIDNNNNILWSGSKDLFGTIAVYTSETLLAGNYTLKLTSPNHLPKVMAIEVIQNETAFIGTTNIDATIQENMFCVNDVVTINLDVKNFGSESFSGDVYIKLITESSYLEVLQDSIFIGSMVGNEIQNLTNSFEIKNLGGYPDGSVVDVKVVSYFGDNSSTSIFALSLNSSNMNLDSFELVTTGISVESGEATPLTVNLTNIGSGNTENVSLMLYSNEPGISISPMTYTLPVVAPSETVNISDVFSINVAESVEDGTQGSFIMTVIDPFFSSHDYEYNFMIGVDQYTFETGFMGFAAIDPTPSSTNEWGVSEFRNHSVNGAKSIKFGGEGSADYASSAYGYLESPSFNVVPGSLLKFYHWMDAENDNQNPVYAWDGGYVEMSVNGGTFLQITPVGNYPYSLRDNEANPIPASTPVYSGSFSWTQAEFPLGNITNNVKFRFVFGSDAVTSGEGWYIDDIEIILPTPNSNSDVIPSTVEISGNYPNPFNPETTIEYSVAGNDTKAKQKVTLDIYNIKGQLVKTLVNDTKTAGNYKAVWNGLNSRGDNVSSGIYFSKLRVGSKTDTKKMILMK